MKRGGGATRVVYSCSFCGKKQDQVHRLIAGPGGVYICDECINLCREIIEEEQRPTNARAGEGAAWEQRTSGEWKPVTINRATVSAWLDAYVQAWKSYDAEAIGNLFSEDATYAYAPYGEPVRGREAIVASWLKDPDARGTYDGHYEPVAIEGNRAVANGRSRYFEADGTTLRTEFDNVFLLRFDGDGRCREYREWYMERPKEEGSRPL